MFGLRIPDMQHWLNIVGEDIRGGWRPEVNQFHDGVLEGNSVLFRSADPSWDRALFGTGRWFAQRPHPTVLQMVWPDRQGRFPWDDGCGERCRVDQP